MPNDFASRVEIFLDGSNFYNGLRQQFGDGRYSVEKLVSRVVNGRILVRLNFYTGLIDPHRDFKGASAQKRFLNFLEALPHPVKLYTRPMRYYTGWPKVPPQEKGVDVMLAIDSILGALDRRYDTAIFLSGDQDFTELVRVLHSRFSIRIETYYPVSRRHLFETAPECFAKGEVITKWFYRSIR